MLHSALSIFCSRLNAVDFNLNKFPSPTSSFKHKRKKNHSNPKTQYVQIPCSTCTAWNLDILCLWIWVFFFSFYMGLWIKYVQPIKNNLLQTCWRPLRSITHISPSSRREERRWLAKATESEFKCLYDATLGGIKEKKMKAAEARGCRRWLV